MYILAFETSCDDTSVALMRDTELVFMSTRTQLEHDVTWGVVPEVAARSHANAIFPCIQDVLREWWITLENIDLIACTEKPWLLPSLLTGMTVAKTLSLSLKKPLLWIDHIESHIFANYLGRSEEDITFPAVVLTVSGWHTEIYFWKSMFDLEMIWQTRDDAAGECFDKIAKMMWLGFPGGAKIARLAEEYGKEIWDMRYEVWAKNKRLFPEVLLERDSLDFSFSGLKSAVKREIDRRGMSYEVWVMSVGTNGASKNSILAESDMREIAYEFEETVTDILSKKLLRAIEKTGVDMMLLAWGVSANTILKSKLENIANDRGVRFLAPVKSLYSMDNAAMVWIRAYYEWKGRS
jgi:N6-L-threonylcarbamoyladenine synthase